MKIVFPELNHPTIQQALAECSTLPDQPPIEALSAPDLTTACQLVTSNAADAMIAGINYSSRDVILACREHFGMAPLPELVRRVQVQLNLTSDNSATSALYSTFSGLAVMQKSDQIFLLADMAACKHPTAAQLREIIAQTITSARAILSDLPRVALLSFSTHGSGGKDDTISLLQSVLTELQPLASPDAFFIDGEMQLDAAINPRIGTKNSPILPVAGRANVLIAPDLNSGNLLYKAFEQIGGFTVAGPILQGFNYPVSDLSRGSSVADVIFTIQTMAKLASKSLT